MKELEKLLNIMDDLRSKCPWDKKQTIDTLKNLTIEEAYELSDAIENKNFKNLKEELGDLLLHIVFYSKIASEKKEFNFKDVVNSLCDKLIYRHPHIYGNLVVNNEREVKLNWEKLKSNKTKKSILSGLPKKLPTILKAQRAQDKASSMGFDWDSISSVKSKLTEEMEELNIEINSKNRNKIKDEFGDVLFTLINYSRFLKIDPEESLKKSTEKFIGRFKILEKIIRKKKQKIEKLSKNELGIIWEESKKIFLSNKMT
ncbi:MAG: nucleoside triphosphate pyrophosphohydrolase [Rickettsiales bacterium]|nr:nucleoside triphosphate pyrophosphohydrolase [Rickettsiales bacterium]|tara:strand:+ start:944 stop:1717 length:774 start_codon:yes stop_codon:yes gene_type:complete